MVAARLGLVTGGTIRSDAVAEDALDALEFAARAGLLRQLLVLAPASFDQHSHASFSTVGQGSPSSFSKGARSSGPMRSISSPLRPANHGRKAVAKVRMVHELCTYSSISLLYSRTCARSCGSRGMSGGRGNASSR